MTVKGGWSTAACDEVNVAGEMVELRCGDLKTLIPYSAILTAIGCAIRTFHAGERPTRANLTRGPSAAPTTFRAGLNG
ncbi:hypothetical protein BZM27_51195 [Paraburkholderia steynii]|uniref:Uncharacterized protein n=1 Tax=Paraburkholderia steynii TaxID=1245441 RepID=A0A4R0X6L0_9BURK|nr:hypothetical protein BZM27_51195 [Paraburkholderia steynii]